MIRGGGFQHKKSLTMNPSKWQLVFWLLFKHDMWCFSDCNMKILVWYGIHMIMKVEIWLKRVKMITICMHKGKHKVFMNYGKNFMIWIIWSSICNAYEYFGDEIAWYNVLEMYNS